MNRQDIEQDQKSAKKLFELAAQAVHTEAMYEKSENEIEKK